MILTLKVAYNMEIVKITKLTKSYDGNPRSGQIQILSRNRFRIILHLPHNIYTYVI